LHTTILDRREGRRRRDEAIDAVDQAADDRWKSDALEAVRQVCLTQRTFTTDDVWAHLGRKDPTRENRAMGPVMLRAKRTGLCEKTGRFVPTKQPTSHACYHAVWRSRLAPGRSMPPRF
jgi:hypothetical protein